MGGPLRSDTPGHTRDRGGHDAANFIGRRKRQEKNKSLISEKASLIFTAGASVFWGCVLSHHGVLQGLLVSCRPVLSPLGPVSVNVP